jgi:hypothetical protein
MALTPTTQARSTRWSLEVVRGRDVGKVYALEGDEIVLGNGLDGAVGVDLRDQEAGSPRRMAARQAVLESRGADLLIRDLDSPGGTFVNRQRLLAGQSRRLQPGDEIQLGGVLLRVTGSANAPTAPQPLPTNGLSPGPSSGGPPPETVHGRLPVPYSIDGGVACRNWDDFLTVAAQRWNTLRDELTSGRLADYLRRIQRNDLLPQTAPGRSPDEQLDHWLGRLPVSRSSAPELEVHPTDLEVRGTGGTTRHVMRITNVGYRLLRSTARIEPAGTRWVKIAEPFAGRTFHTIEDTELPIEVEFPERPDGRLAAEVVIESNGGVRRIPVRIAVPERPPALPDAPAGSPALTISEVFGPVAQTLARVRPPARIAGGIIAGLVFRGIVLASGLLAFGAPGVSISGPRLPALAALCAAIGVIAGVSKAWRWGDRGATGVAAGLVGIMVAAVIYALVNTVERPLGDWSSSLLAVGLLWAALGAGVAGLTCLIVPARAPSRETST